ncbi:hypothetical protein ZIOFF_016465 [Zingiber officinale]|uniref:Uncharacterized protein n=1 Tax=Zingiber officinale TaxID=94328 RepID=A0A8J5HGG5_ZINOF|nr:hypothetical protein ZIOFF_016465 [Zingiber officinale]
MKKAKELTVLCDAQVSIIMFSSTGKLSEYCSPSSETKAIFDRYQQKMQNYLNHLKEINRNLRKEIRQRMGEGLDGIGIKELRGLEQNLDEALKVVRERKYHLIGTQTDTYKKKVNTDSFPFLSLPIFILFNLTLKSAQEAHRNLLQDLEIEGDQAAYGYAVEDTGSQDGPVVLADGGSHIYAIQVQPNQPNLQGIAYGFYDLRLA